MFFEPVHRSSISLRFALLAIIALHEIAFGSALVAMRHDVALVLAAWMLEESTPRVASRESRLLPAGGEPY